MKEWFLKSKPVTTRNKPLTLPTQEDLDMYEKAEKQKSEPLNDQEFLYLERSDVSQNQLNITE